MIKNEVAFLSHLIGVIKRHHHCSSQLNRYLYFMRELIKVQPIRVLMQWKMDLKIVHLTYYSRQFLPDNSGQFGCAITCLVVSFLGTIFLFYN